MNNGRNIFCFLDKDGVFAPKLRSRTSRIKII